MMYNKYPLSEIVDIISGGTPKKSVKEYWENGTIPWLSIKDFNNDNRRVYDSSDYITELGLENSSANLLEKGDVILSARGTVGEVAQLARRMAFNQSCFGLRANDKYTTNEYIYYWLKHNISYLKNNTHGSVFDTINRKTFENLYVELPTKQYQNEVTEILTRLDDKIELNKQITDNLEEIASTLFNHWFVDFEFLDENGNPYKSSGGKMVESELRKIPEGWKTVCLSEIGDIVAGGTPSKTKNEYYENGNIAWITPKDLSGNKSIFISEGATDITELGLKKSSAKILPKYSVLFSSRAPIGYLAINKNEVCTKQGFKSIVPNEGIPYQFIYFYLKNNIGYIESIAGGSTFKEISGTAMKNLKVTLPPTHLLKEYRQIVETIFNNIENFEGTSQILSELRDTLLPKLLLGEIEIPTEEEA